MSKLKIENISRRMGEGGAAARVDTGSGELDRATVITVIRRTGYVAAKVHEVIMGRLISQGEHELAERFNDLYKPLVDMLIHFDLDQ